MRVTLPPSGDRWLRLATGGYACRSHRLPSGGAARVTLPPSGDRWLRRQVASATGGYACRSHPLPSGGAAARVTLPPSGDRWLRRQVATLVVAIGCQAVVRREEGFHRLATGGYGDRWLENS